MHGFRLRFWVAPGRALAFPEPLTVSLAGGVELTVKADQRGAMILHAEGMSEAEARQRGERVRRAVRLVGVKLRLGVDTGNDRPIGGPGRVVRERAAQEGVSLLPAVHGLAVFDATRPVRFLGGHAEPLLSQPAPPVMATVAAIYGDDPALSQKQDVAVDVYNASRFERSVRARFLSLITAVECIAEPEERSAEVRAMIDGFVRQVEASGLSGDARGRLENALRMLKRESIRKACKDVVVRRCGPDAARFFIECHDARSRLVHAGTSSPRVQDDVGRLDALVSEFLVRDIEGVTGEASREQS